VYLGGPLFFHRATLLNTLVSNIPKEMVHLGKRLKSYEQVLSDERLKPQTSQTIREDIILHFTDDTSARADILVGSDGIKSAVRRQMYTSYASEIGASVQEYVEKYVEPAWTGSIVYRSLIPAEELRKVNPAHSIFKGPQQVRSITFSV
jgi:salicylate hydroxylase